jgi:hypothetical protein
MKTKTTKIMSGRPDARRACIAVIFILGAITRVWAGAFGPAVWNQTDAYNAWAGWNDNFCYTNSSGYQWFGTNIGDSVIPGLWEEAEELQIVEDAYWYSKDIWQGNYQSYATKINCICQGITNNFPVEWQNAVPNDRAPNDDLMWTTCAFTRAYNITGNQEWLNEAITAFNIVWDRAQMTNGSGEPDAKDFGLVQVQGATNVDSEVNFTFVIAAHLLAGADPGNKSFYIQAGSDVYNFCVTNNGLYKPSGKVRDATSTNSSTDYTLNYGIAINAACCQNDEATAENVANYLTNSFGGGAHPYQQPPWTNGPSVYNLLPDYEANGGNYKNNAGFSSILFRGLGTAYNNGFLPPGVLTWAQINLQAAFYHRDGSTSLMWGDLEDHTLINNQTYSWDCSSAVSGMLNIPAP